LGKSLQAFAESHGGEEAWMEALPGLKKLGEILTREEGAFVLGSEGKSVVPLLIGVAGIKRLTMGSIVCGFRACGYVEILQGFG
jgi:hypothetical protein